jgi:biopolymer transport protein TolR
MVTYRKHRKRLMAEINVVPYIDVMLVLLVIFMITAPLLTQGVQVDLPKAAANPVNPADNETLVVTVDRKGNYFLDDRAIDPEALQAKVAAILRLRPKTPVMIRGDLNVPYNEVVKAMVVLQAAGAPSVGLLTQPPETKRSDKVK